MNGFDEQLIKRVAKGNCRALELLMFKYKGKAYSWACRVATNQIDKDEIVNNVWMKIWRKAHQFEGRAKFSTWFFEVCRTEALTWLRDKKSVHMRDLDISIMEFPKEETQIRHLYFKQLVKEAQSAFEKVKPVWAIEVLDSLSAQRFMHNTGTAKSRRKRGHDQFMRILHNQLSEDFNEAVNF